MCVTTHLRGMSTSRRTLDRLDVDQTLVAKLESRGCRTAEDALYRSPLDVVELADCSHARARELLRGVARAVAPAPTTAFDALRAAKFIPTLVKDVDRALGGGLAIGSVTEVVGAAGAGKTQLCLTACASACAPTRVGGADGGVIYIDAERKFSGARLEEIARAKFGEAFASEAEAEATWNRVRVATPTSLSDLAKRLEALEEAIIDHKVRLVIIDSVAHLARGEFGREKVMQRQSVLGAIAATLKRHAEKHGLAVLAVNQVTTRIGGAITHGAHDASLREPPAPGAEEESSGITAALGTKWAHCVNTRVVLEVTPDKRLIKIVKSPLAPLTAFRYHVDSSGIVIDETMNSSSMRAREANVASTHRR